MNSNHVTVVNGLSRSSSRGWLKVGQLRFPCALGQTGRRADKREGDGATPIGRWRIVRILYRRDRISRPRTAHPTAPIGPNDGWCDAVGDGNYNRFVRHPYRASAERLWREDHLYDVVVVLDHNASPRVQGRGSAIFMHVARPNFRPTAGCIALRLADLRRVLAALPAGAAIVVP